MRTFEVRKGKEIFGKFNTKQEAIKELRRLLYNINDLELVEVIETRRNKKR